MGRRRQNWIHRQLRAMPWWTVAVLAPASYGGFRWLETHGSSLSAVADQYPLQLAVTMSASLAKWSLPAYLSIVALANLFYGPVRRWRGRWSQDRVANGIANAPDFTQALARMPWQHFEHLVAAAFRKQGFRVDTTVSGADGGVDVRMSRNGHSYVVQCKRYTRSKVSVQTVRELRGVMATEGVHRGIVVSSNGFTRSAWQFAKSDPSLQLMGPKRLKAMLEGVQWCPENGLSSVTEIS